MSAAYALSHSLCTALLLKSQAGERQSASWLRMATFETHFTALFFILTDSTRFNLMHCIAAHGYRRNTHEPTAQASRTLRLCSGMKALRTRAPST